LPIHKIELKSYSEIDPFEEEEFDFDDATKSCENYYQMDHLSSNDFEGDDPKPEIEDYDTQEEFEDAMDQWQSDIEEKKQEYLQEQIDDCVSEKKTDHDNRQETLRRNHEKSQTQGYLAQFNAAGQDFEVHIEQENYSYLNFKDIYNISFIGPDHHSTTKRNSSGQALEIYSHLIASIVKMAQLEKSKGNTINGFSFSAYDPEMIPVYNMFYNNYLRPQGYIKMGSLYLNKNYLRDKMSHMKDEEKKYILSKMITQKRDDRDYLKNIKNKKNKLRIEKMEIDKLIGKIILFKHLNKEYAGLAYRSDVDSGGNFLYVEYVPTDGWHEQSDAIRVYFDDIVFNKEPSQSEIVNLVKILEIQRPSLNKFLEKYKNSHYFK